MVDALLPAAAALEQGGDLAEAASRAADAAEEGMRATTDLVARKGRASYLGERSRGHQDPGATSSALMMRAAAEAFANPS
jgi:phosphoenolpyruvate---glycerone phosphotransferase subunit DhaL